MAYAAISFVFNEQPSTAKWNILGTNDASFNDGTGLPTAGSSAALVATAEGTTSSFPVDLATSGPAVTMTPSATGIVIVHIYSRLISSAATGSCQMGFAASVGNVVAAADDKSILKVGDTADRFGASFLLTGLAAASTTFTAKYGRGTTGTSTFSDRRIAVIKL